MKCSFCNTELKYFDHNTVVVYGSQKVNLHRPSMMLKSRGIRILFLVTLMLIFVDNDILEVIKCILIISAECILQRNLLLWRWNLRLYMGWGFRVRVGIVGTFLGLGSLVTGHATCAVTLISWLFGGAVVVAGQVIVSDIRENINLCACCWQLCRWNLKQGFLQTRLERALYSPITGNNSLI